MNAAARPSLRHASLAVVMAVTLAACAPVGGPGGMGSGGMGSGGMGSGGMGSGGMRSGGMRSGGMRSGGMRSGGMRSGGMGSSGMGGMGGLDARGGTPDRDDGHGETDAPPPVPGAREVTVEGGEFFFAPGEFRIDAGEPINLTVANTGEVFHDFTIADLGFMLDLAAGATATAGLTIDRPGEYQFRCTVPGHAAAGMEGTLIVEDRPR